MLKSSVLNSNTSRSAGWNSRKRPIVARFSLRQKTLLVMGLTLTGLIGVLYAASYQILIMSLTRAEIQSAEQSIQGVLSVLAKTEQDFESRYTDWSAWDDTYTFIQDRNPEYIQSNLVPEQMARLKVNLVLYVNRQGTVVYGTGVDLLRQRFTPLPQGIEQLLASNSRLLTYQANRPVTGLVRLPEGAMLITSQPILTSAGQGPIRGSLIFGRYLDAQAIANLSKISRFPLSTYSWNATAVPNDVEQARTQLSVQKPTLVRTANEQLLIGYALLVDLNQQPAAILRVELPREIYAQGQLSQSALIISTVLVGLIFGIVSLVCLERLVLARLGRLTSGVRQVQASEDLSLRLPIQGTDELADLATHINCLLETLNHSQNELQTTLQQWTTANTTLRTTVQQLETEVAERQQAEASLRDSEARLQEQTVQLTATLMELQQAQTQLIQSEKMSSLGQLVAGIAHEINNPVNFIHGNLGYVAAYAQDLLQLSYLYHQHYPVPHLEIQSRLDTMELDFINQDLPKLLNSMQVGTDRICDIVRSLRNFSRLDEADIKAVDLHQGLDSTLLILQNRLKSKPGSPGIHVLKEYGDLPPVECYAGQVNQVFMNILSNAIDALEDRLTEVEPPSAGDAPFIPTIRIQTRATQQRVRIAIADNGSGMSETTKQHIFDPFFTTKPVGKGTGLGLSISYQIITQKHQGSFECHSAPGQGTEFVVELPCQL